MELSRRVVVRLLLISMWAVSLMLLVYPARAQAQGWDGGVHVVEPGETLRDVAQQAGTDVGTLIAINGLSNGDVIYVGQQLSLPGGPSNNGEWQQPSQNYQDNGPGADPNNGPSGGPGWANQDNQRQGTSYDPSQEQYSQQGQYQQGQYQQGPYQQGAYQQSEQYNRTPGVAYDPAYSPENSQQGQNTAGPQGPYGPDPNWGEPQWDSQPDQGDEYSQKDSWTPQDRQQGPSQPDNDWSWTHQDEQPYGQGNGWEPAPSAPEYDSAPAYNDSQLSGEKWIDIDLSKQQLYAYQGDTMVRSFIISSGSATYPTVTGTYYTYARYDIQDMSGGSVDDGTYYFQPDVPWVQYFFEGYSIHGAYWHNQFGSPIGHGCINMRVGEAEWLYDWTAVTGIRVVVHY